jgi:hypothetical protein
MMKIRRVAAAVLAAVAAGALAGAQMGRAQSADDPTINGCYDTTTGTLRVLTASNGSCAAGESAISWNSAQVMRRWYKDADDDGYGDWYIFIESAAQPAGYVANNDDCYDKNVDVHPKTGQLDTAGDSNCNGVVAEDRIVKWFLDADGDGWGRTYKPITAPETKPPAGYVHRYGDCNDANKAVHPYQVGCHHDGDIDGDGHRSAALPGGGDDCDDADPNRYPGRTEVPDAFGIDEDCDPETGIAMPFDPHFLDPRPHDVFVSSQLGFTPGGMLSTTHGVGALMSNGEPTTVPRDWTRWPVPFS